ncbi:hypothetical protein RIF29_41432 [Crotalaria pallida]|uniref:Uncharacterized protein n=1 Tax=Crotalaria pallida TaxID=3830 RepID=A0AAN9E813_CROPI
MWWQKVIRESPHGFCLGFVWETKQFRSQKGWKVNVKSSPSTFKYGRCILLSTLTLQYSDLFYIMDLLGSFEWFNAYGKKRCKSLFWRTRAAVKKALKRGGKKKQLKFQYDPSSYALNFDDGCSHFDIRDAAKKFMADARVQELTDMNNNSNTNNTTWVFVLLVKTM